MTVLLPSSQGRAEWGSTYLYGRRGIFGSSAVPPGIATYTFAHLSVAADATGVRFVPEGTTLMTYGATGMVTVRTERETAVGVLVGNHSFTADREVGAVVSGVLNETRLWDLGVFGSVAADVKTALPFVQFVQKDL